MGTYILVSLVMAVIFAAICLGKMYFVNAELRHRAEQNPSWLEDYEKTKKSQRKSILICSIVIFLFFGLINWLCTPAIALTRSGIYWEILFVCIISIFILSFDEDIDFDWNPVHFVPLILVGLIMGLAEFGSGQWIQQNRHRDLLDMNNDDVKMIVGNDEATLNQDSLFNESISPVSLEKMRVVTPGVAKLLAEQLVEQITAFGSQYELGELSLQSITGKFDITDGLNKTYHLKFDNDFIYVAPLEFQSFWKWNGTNGISRAYVIVSATNENQYYLVLKVNGQPLEMKYLKSAFFGKELRRHLRYNGYFGKVADTGIQIDSKGRPYNVFAKIENQIGWGGDKVTGSLVVDVQNGEINEYSLENTPDFIDIVQPEELLQKNIYRHYDLIHGYLNWSNRDILRPAAELFVIYGQNTCCYYTGLSSTGNDQSTSGFALADARTGVTTFYKMSGINGSRAAGAINAHEWTAKYADYAASEAIIYNIGGLQTYYAPIVSGNKVVGHGFCYQKNINVVGAGKTKEEAYASYMRSYHQSQITQSAPSDGKNVEDVILTIVKIRQENDRYNFLFKEYEGITFYTFSELTPEVRWVDENTKQVKVSFRMSEDKSYPIKKLTLLK